jgi:hypothetical protein
MLLSQIHQGAQLRKTEVRDRSAPVIECNIIVFWIYFVSFLAAKNGPASLVGSIAAGAAKLKPSGTACINNQSFDS